MKILECEQGSPEWFQHHLGRFSGSEISGLIYEPGIYKTGDKKDMSKPIPQSFLNLVDQKISELEYGLTQYEIDKRVGRLFYENYEPSIGLNGKYGKLMEPDAREYYSKKYDEEIYTVGFVLSEIWPDHVGVSPDALNVRKSSGLEIKCPVTLSIHLKASKLKTANDLKEFNEAYYWQVLLNLMVCETERWDFVSYLPFVAPEKVMSCLEISRNEVESDLKLLEQRIIDAINLKTK